MSSKSTNLIEKWEKTCHRNYEVSDLGRVRSLPHIQEIKTKNGNEYKRYRRGKMLKLRIRSHGYLGIQLGAGKERQIHSLVMEAFVGKRPKGKEVNHKDGNKKNNQLNNLEYVTSIENKKHSMELGLWKSNKGKKLTFLNFKDVRIIRELIKKGIPLSTIAKKFDTYSGKIARIARNETFKRCI